MSGPIEFLLNNRRVLTNCPPGTLVLDFLRRFEGMVGTKEGCKEGDCGACVVLVGELSGSTVKYEPITSCLMPVAELHGRHLVTVEGLNAAVLTPVQQAIVNEGGSQCGFCTPGIVMSLTGYLLQLPGNLDMDGIKTALGGNLCRCTGYSSLKRAGQQLIDHFDDGGNNRHAGSADTLLADRIQQGVVPAYFGGIAERLGRIARPAPANGLTEIDFFVAGGTDIYVQRGEDLPDMEVGVLNTYPGMSGIEIKNGNLHVGALVTFESFAGDKDVQKIIPDIIKYNHYNASWQIRNRATLGGNIVNASPIGDMTALLLALESRLILRSKLGDRVVPLRSFFKGYKQLDMQRDEILTEIVIPVPSQKTKINFVKVCKRKTLDIASVNSGVKIVANGARVQSIALTMGGVAPVPYFMAGTCEFLRGRDIDEPTLSEAIDVAQHEVSPISDIRGSADYKRLLVRQLIIAHFTKLFPRRVRTREFYEAY